MKEVDVKAINYISKNNLVVLRSKISGLAINVSYSEDGLKFTADKNGRYVYFSNPDDLSGGIDKNMVVEKFIPRNHKSIGLQTAEFLMVKKAYKMLYTVDSPYVN